ncbi:hypothetical protein HanRHA438_Chr13g0605811 [Helianthus annuus]|nr:hypothetical protein HanHA300_Chr13g0488111 [Helianthus annuus]KAJ0498237.1 hypothetical protein HanHA89_Chr13g0520301 [Helianthus annuus]KAJ0664240.1 hypothetical protein HanLR1_Chr13g0490161 [Helianthus annuus]KAJ0671712.1 hypothetical protein HanOQP8_Chr13g0488741 [Helianthus annuus]KAJ0858848.1 hypothetical protein HanRHA438_Chr13g0605811 [Helianthus annuus]
MESISTHGILKIERFRQRIRDLEEIKRPRQRVRDLEEIRRLRQRVRDLEEIRRLRQRVRDLEEIRRLRQRVRDLELQRERRVMETESGPIVRDDVNEEEENPFGRYPPRFYEPIYQENLSEEEPRFDEDRIEFDEEECSLVQMILSGITSRDDKAVKKINDHEYVKVSAAIFDDFVVGENTFAGSDASPNLVATDGETNLESPLFWPSSSDGDNGKEEKIWFSRDKGHISPDDVCMTSMHDNSTPGHINIGGNSSGLHEDELCNHATNKNGSHKNKIVEPSFKSIRNNNSVANIGVEKEVSSSNAHWLPIVNEIVFDAQFDPGGTSFKLGEMIHEVKMFRRVMIINRNRVDVPFDPDGFGLKTKLEDEVFFF